MFKGIKNNFKKSEAAVVVQNLLEMQKNAGVFEGDPASTATQLVANAWDRRPELFDGRFGQRPHKISLAAAALCDGLQVKESQDTQLHAYMLAIANIMLEVSKNGHLYPFNSIDGSLFSEAEVVFQEIKERMMEGIDEEELSALLGL